MALTVNDDGTVAARKVLTEPALVVDAIEELVLVQTSGGTEAVTMSGQRHRIPESGLSVARDGDGFLVGWKSADAAGVRRLNAEGAPVGEPLVLQSGMQAPRGVKVVSLGDEALVVWGDDLAIRAAIVRDGAVVRRLDVATGFLLAATATPRGAIVLVSRGCGIVTTFLLPRDAGAFEEPRAVSLAATPQSAHAVATTRRGTQVFWTELVPTSSAHRLYATFIDSRAHEPLLLNTPGTYVFDAEATPMGDGTAAAWVEYTPGTATARAARFDANGQLLGDVVTVATATNIPFINIAANDTSIVVVAAEKQGTYTYYADLWATRLSPAGAIEERTLMTTRVEAFSLDAAMSDRGVVASWFDQAGGAVRVNVREPRASHVAAVPEYARLAGPRGERRGVDAGVARAQPRAAAARVVSR